MRVLKKKNLFFKFLFSYLLVLLIPVLWINGLFSYRFIRAYKKEVQNQVNLNLVHLSDYLDSEILNLSTIVDQMHMSMDFSKYHFDDDPLGGRSYIDHLTLYSTTNSFIDKIALYIRNEDYMFLQGTSCRVDLFLNQLYRFADTPAEELKGILADAEHRVILPQQVISTPGENAEYLTVWQPLYTDYQTICGTCIFFIRTDLIRQRASQQWGTYDAILRIKDPSGKLLIQTADLEDSLSYFESTYVSKASGWEYTAYVPENQQFLMKINAISRELFLVTIVVIISAIILIWFLMNINYAPICDLGKKASALLHIAPKSGELETISNTLDFLSNQNQHLASELENSAMVLKSNRIHKLLTGHYMSREDFNLDGQDLNIEYQNDWFFVVIIQIHGAVSDYDTFALYIQDLLRNSMESFYTFTPDPDKIILVNSINPDHKGEVCAVLEDMRQTVKDEKHLDLTIGVGKIYEGTVSIPRSYLEARSALDYRFVKGNANTISFQDLFSNEKASSLYPKQQFRQLKEAVSRSDTAMIHTSVSSLIDYIQKHNLPLFVAKGICFDILSMFTEISPSCRYILSDAVDTLGLMQWDTLDEVISFIQQLNAELDKQPLEPPKQDSDILLEDIISYIEANCLRCDFSIQETADHFHMLLPNLSQFFKDKTGQNVLDYSTTFRMEHAKKMMATPALALKDICQQVGYYNTSSFIRRFKQLYGITPGDYRKKLGEAEK